MKVFAALMISLGSILPLAWLRGFVICQLWLWFFVPGFNVPPIALVTALGVSLMASLLTFQLNGYKFSEDELAGSILSVLASAGISLISLFGGWLYLAVFS